MAYQPVDIGSAPNDGTGDPIRDAFDKINDNFVEVYAGLTGLLDFKGSTDCSANPNYPAASKGDFYLVSVAGKIGGASGIVVEVQDSYFALADNAGGTQAAVGTSWTVVQGNITSYLPLSGGTLTGDLIVPDEAYDATAWDASLEVPTKNAIRDKIESLAGGTGIDVEDEGVSEATGATTLNFVGAGVVAADMGGGVVDVTIAGGGSGIDVEDEGVSEATGASTLNFTGAGVTATDVGGGVVDVTIPGGGGGGAGTWEHIETLNPSAVASINSEAWVGLGYKALRATFVLTPSNDQTTLSVRYKLNGSYKTTTYKHTGVSYSSGGGGGNQGTTPTTGIAISGTGATWGMGNDTLEHATGTFTIYDPDNTVKPKTLTYQAEYGLPSGGYAVNTGGGTYDSTDYADGLEGWQLIVSAGTITGRIIVEGLV